MTPPPEAASAPPEVRHLLVLKPSSLGDIVHTLPAVAALRERHPQARITWMVNPEWAPLLEGNPHIDDTLIFPRGDFRGPAGWLHFRRWRAGLPAQIQPDIILDFQGLLRTALVARAFRGVPVHGLADAREGARFFQTHTVRTAEGAHAVERYLALASSLGARTDGVPVFQLPPGSEPRADLPGEPFVVLHPFSRGRGKSLDTAAVHAFCRAAGHPVVLAGRTDKPPGSLPENAVDLLNRTTLPELIWLLRRAAFVVSVDSGPMHLAAALTGKVLSIHTWSDPCKVGPYNPAAHVWKGERFFPALDPAASTAGEAVPTQSDATRIGLWVAERIAGRAD